MLEKKTCDVSRRLAMSADPLVASGTACRHCATPLQSWRRPDFRGGVDQHYMRKAAEKKRKGKIMRGKIQGEISLQRWLLLTFFKHSNIAMGATRGAQETDPTLKEDTKPVLSSIQDLISQVG